MADTALTKDERRKRRKDDRALMDALMDCVAIDNYGREVADLGKMLEVAREWKGTP
jgi:hypothetical protein